jgi:hypothetical protein
MRELNRAGAPTIRQEKWTTQAQASPRRSVDDEPSTALRGVDAASS